MVVVQNICINKGKKDGSKFNICAQNIVFFMRYGVVKNSIASVSSIAEDNLQTKNNQIFSLSKCKKVV